MARFFAKLTCVLFGGVCLLSAGCQEFVGEQARQSFTSFVTSVVTTAINEALNPE
jgi:hypothetical protein